jgi:hypothetical protein
MVVCFVSFCWINKLIFSKKIIMLRLFPNNHAFFFISKYETVLAAKTNHCSCTYSQRFIYMICRKYLNFSTLFRSVFECYLLILRMIAFFFSLKYYFNLHGCLRMKIENFVVLTIFFKATVKPNIYLIPTFKTIVVVRHAKTWNVKGRAATEKKTAGSSDGWTSEETRSSWHCISSGCILEKWRIWELVYSSTK